MGALQFDGVDDILLHDASPVTAAPFTVGVWAEATDATGTETLWAFIKDNSTFIGWYFHTVNGTIRFGAEDGAGFASASSTAAHSTTWFSAAAVEVTSSNRSAFLDGANEGTNATSKAPAATPGNMAAGAYIFVDAGVPQEDFVGHMAYVFIWDVALSDVEVADWHAGDIPQLADLVAMYDLTVAPVGDIYENLVSPGTFDFTVSGGTFNSGESYTGPVYELVPPPSPVVIPDYSHFPKRKLGRAS